MNIYQLPTEKSKLRPAKGGTYAMLPVECKGGAERWKTHTSPTVTWIIQVYRSLESSTVMAGKKWLFLSRIISKMCSLNYRIFDKNDTDKHSKKPFNK